MCRNLIILVAVVSSALTGPALAQFTYTADYWVGGDAGTLTSVDGVIDYQSSWSGEDSSHALNASVEVLPKADGPGWTVDYVCTAMVEYTGNNGNAITRFNPRIDPPGNESYIFTGTVEITASWGTHVAFVVQFGSWFYQANDHDDPQPPNTLTEGINLTNLGFLDLLQQCVSSDDTSAATITVSLQGTLEPPPPPCSPMGISWLNAAGGLFSNEMNWQGETVPGAQSNAMFAMNPGIAQYTVVMDQNQENVSAFVNDFVTLDLQQNLYTLNELACPSLSIGNQSDSAASLKLRNGVVTTLSDVVIGAAENAAAGLSLQNNSMLDVPALSAIRVGTSNESVQSGGSSLAVEAGSQASAGSLIVSAGGEANLFTDNFKEPKKVVVGSNAVADHPDAVAALLDDIVINAGGEFSTEHLLVTDGTATATGAGAVLGDLHGGVIKLEVENEGVVRAEQQGKVQATLTTGNGTIEIADGGTMNTYRLEAGIGSEPGIGMVDIGPGGLLTNHVPSDPNEPGDGLIIGKTGEAELLVHDGGTIECPGLIFGGDQDGHGTGTVTGLGSCLEGYFGPLGGAMVGLKLGDAIDSSGALTISDFAKVQSVVVEMARGIQSPPEPGEEVNESTLIVENAATLIADEIRMFGNGVSKLEIKSGGAVLLPDLNGSSYTNISLGFDPDGVVSGSPVAAVLNLTGAGSMLSSHGQNLPEGAPTGVVSFLTIANEGRAIVSDQATLRIGAAICGAGEDSEMVIPHGGLLRIDGATAEFFTDDGNNDLVQIPELGHYPTQVGAGGALYAENGSTVTSKDIIVHGDGELRVEGDGTTWSGTNALVFGTDDDGILPGGLLDIDFNAQMTLISLDVVNAGTVWIRRGGGLTTTSFAEIGGGYYDDLTGPHYQSFSKTARVILDGSQGPATWVATTLNVGGPGSEPNVPDIPGELSLIGQAELTVSTLTVHEDGSVIGNGTVIAANPPVVHHGGLLAVNLVNPAAPPLSGGTAGPSLTIIGDLIAEPGSIVQAEIAGAAPSEYGSLTVSGSAVIDGAVELKFIDGYGPSAGHTFDVLAVQGGSVFGPTMTTEVSGLAPGFKYDVQTDPKTGVLTVTALNDGVWVGSCPADVDADGTVGVGDLLALLAVWGPCPGCQGDLNGDGVVNVSDLLAILAAWGPCE